MNKTEQKEGYEYPNCETCPWKSACKLMEALIELFDEEKRRKK